MSADASGTHAGLVIMLRALKLPTVSRCAEEVATKAEGQNNAK